MEINEILEQREARYGDFRDVAQISQNIMDNLRSGASFYELDYDQLEALSMISNKLARVVNGDVTYEDSWRDIAGYATLVADRLLLENSLPTEESA